MVSYNLSRLILRNHPNYLIDLEPCAVNVTIFGVSLLIIHSPALETNYSGRIQCYSRESARDRLHACMYMWVGSTRSKKKYYICAH